MRCRGSSTSLRSFQNDRKKAFASEDDAESAGELLLQDFVDNLRVGLAAHRLHHLADEKSEQLVAPAPILRELVRFRGEHLVACGRDRALIGYLRKAELANRRLRGLARGAHRGEDGLRRIEADLGV